MPAKQTKQPSVSGAESKSVRGCRGSPVSRVQVGSVCENRRGQKEKVNSQHSQSLDEICRTHTGGVFWQIVSLICYQQQQSSGSVSNVLFRNPHYDNESDFDEERNQSGRLNVEWMAALNPSIISKVEWVSACPDVLGSLFLTDVYSWPCQAFYYQSYGSNSTKLPRLTAKVALWSSWIINPVTWGRQLTGWWAFFRDVEWKTASKVLLTKCFLGPPYQ